MTDLVRDRSDPNAWFTSSLDGTVRRWDARMAQVRSLSCSYFFFWGGGLLRWVGVWGCGVRG